MGTENAHFVCGNEESYLNIGDGDDGQFAVTRWCKNTLNAQQHFCDSYAHTVGDERRPFARDTWHAAFEAWMNTQ